MVEFASSAPLMSPPFSRVFQHKQTIRRLLALQPSDTVLHVNGWVKSLRIQKRIAFAMITDGSCAQNLQVVFPDPQLPRKFSQRSCCRMGI
jgi:asparaginyl-tRNA synthetase